MNQLDLQFKLQNMKSITHQNVIKLEPFLKSK